MNIQLTTLLEPTEVSATAGGAQLYHNGTGQSVLLQKVTFTNNTSATTNALSVWWLPSGTAATSAAFLVVNAVNVSPKGPTNDGVYEAICLEGHILAPGDSIWAQAANASQIVAAMSGSLIS